jgi:hypothetical protein
MTNGKIKHTAAQKPKKGKRKAQPKPGERKKPSK